MSIISVHELKRHGRARRVTICMGGEPVRLHDVGVWIEPDLGLVDLLDFDMARHLATLPLSAVFVEWEDTSEARGHAAMERQADVHAHGHGHA